MKKDKILLFIPMYNCENQIIRVLNQLDNDICHFLDEIIVINNRSTDNGEQNVSEFIKNSNLDIVIKLLRNDDNYGLGGSHKVAFDYAVNNSFDYIIVLHGDDQGSISDISPYIKKGIYKKYDCLLGARFMRGSKLRGYSLFRTVGNIVYNILFSVICKKRIYDLGSGLNMYSVKMLDNKFYNLFPDNLVFNYCMILASSYYNHNVRFFPIEWKEEDQRSNVKMLSQSITVLKLLLKYVLNKRKFINTDHRFEHIDKYSYKEIVFNER